MRLIDADAAKAELLRMVGDIHGWGEFFDGIRSGYQSAADRLDTMPTVEERKHGHWGNGYCTVCGESAATDGHCDFIAEEEQKYCWNCGAIMDGQAICND